MPVVPADSRWRAGCDADGMIDLYWLPLGAGGHVVRRNGEVYEAVAARLGRRPRCDLYHSALQVRVPEGTFVIEMTPVRAGPGTGRGVVAEGAVGDRRAGRVRLFRYEIRRWRDGRIPDVGEAVDSPRHLSDDPERARRLLALVPLVPTPVWGRDELATGDMWNSNSVTSWLIARSGPGVEEIRPPAGGRAPGWDAGVVVAARGGELPTSVRCRPDVGQSAPWEVRRPTTRRKHMPRTPAPVGRFDTGEEDSPQDHAHANRFSEGQAHDPLTPADAAEGDFATGEHDDPSEPQVHGDFATGEHDA
jgi:hypothetical protein